MAARQIFGWLLLIIGIAIIGYIIFASFNIFTGKNEAPEIFKIEIKEEDLATLKKDKFTGKPEDIQKAIEETVAQQLKVMVPIEFISNLLNLISWSIFAGLLIFAGGQISNLGIKLIK